MSADAGQGLAASAYADAFARGPPREGVQRVQARLHKARILSDELADYFGARRELETSYLKSLQKIAKRSFLSDPSALGPNFSPIYERLVAEIGEIARIHGDLERKIELECEQPMRSAADKGEWAKIKEHDDNLSGTLKEIASLEQQLAKDQKKVEGASSKKAGQAQQKVAETERALRQTMELWEAESPFAFEGYQRIDAQRLDLMKEVVAKFETAQSDAAQRIMQMTEQSMQVTLNFDPQVDMQEFVLKYGTSSSAPSRVVRPPRAAERAGADSRATPEQAAASQPATNAASVYDTNGVNEFGRSSSIHSADRTRDQQQPQQSTPSKTLGGSTLKSALTRFGRGRSNRNVNEGTSSNYGTLPESASTAMMSPPSSTLNGNKSRGLNDGRQSFEAASSGGPAPADLMQPLAPKSAFSAPPVSSTPPQVDSEGFSIPPANRDRKPWETGNAAVSSPSLMDDDEPNESLDSALAPRMTGMSIAQAPIREDDASDQAALERMRSTLLTTRAPQAPQRRNTTRRDRRDVRNTTYNPLMTDASRPMSTFGLSGISAGNASTTSQAGSSAFIGSPGLGAERTQSMLSSASLSNVGNATLDSIAAGGPIERGLNAQVTERVNVVMNGRNVAKIMVVGEISVSVADVTATSALHLRIDSFEQLEKVAPNPQYMKEIADQPGEYTMDLPLIIQHSGAGKTGKGQVTLLKYQLHVPSHRADEYVPLHVSPQWRCEDRQTSLLINYSANEKSRIASASSAPSAVAAKITDITMSVDVTSGEVSNIMSKPPAMYVAEQKKLIWRIGEPLEIDGGVQGAAAQKALARFQVDVTSDVRPVEVRWKAAGITLSSLGISLVDSDDVAFSNVSRQLVSGKYLANP